MKVVTLCGSTRFQKQFREMEAKLTLRGIIVLSVGFFEKSEGISITAEQEAMFGAMHLKKIEMADEIFVIDADGYIGDSTRKEISYAEQLGKPVRYYSQSCV